MGNFSSYIKLIKKEKQNFPSLSFWGAIKYYKRWSDSLEQDSNTMGDLPWMNFGAIDFLKANANANMKVFEYGSGSSTLFWAKLAKEVISIEHDAAWSKNVGKQLADRHISNVQLFYIEPEKVLSNEHRDIADPFQYATDDDTWRTFSFEKYARKIEAYPADYFDFVIVDGRARPSCIGAAISKVSKGGFLVVDNSEREYYFSKTNNLLPPDKWLRIDFCGPVPGLSHFHQTSFFKRIK